MFDFSAIWSGFARQTVLCIGDCMLDEFVYGDVSRVSPEAPTLVMAVRRTDIMAGGAANVARNVAALGATCLFIGLIGRDEAAATLTAVLQKEARIEPILVAEEGRATTRKARFVSEHFSTHMLRADWEEARPADARIEKALLDQVLSQLPRADALVLSDYAKGVLTPALIRHVIDAARASGKPVVVDPKGSDYSVYHGATLVTPNRKELSEAVHRDARTDAEVAAAASGLRDALHCEAVLVTRSDEGMTLVARDAPPVHVPSYAVKISDVSGAGDTVVAVLSAMLALRADYESAMRAANAAGPSGRYQIEAGTVSTASEPPGHEIFDHIADVGKMVDLGSDSRCEIDDIPLARSTGYVSGQTGDGPKRSMEFVPGSSLAP